MSARFDLILACYVSHQMTEQQWQEHLRDELFSAWYKSKVDKAKRGDLVARAELGWH